MLKRLCIITNKYPTSIEPNVLVFLQQLVWEFADQGIECSAICPLPVNINPIYAKIPFMLNEKTENGATIDLYFPKYIGFGQSYIMGNNPAGLTTNNFTSSAMRVTKKMVKKPDAFYGHFLTPAGIAVARLGRIFNIPSFMAYGEATYMTIDHIGLEIARKELTSLSGVISVSSKNKLMLTSLDIAPERIIKVFPNGYRDERFYPRDKKEAREKYGFPRNKFIVCFVGSFDHRKGIERLSKAIDTLNDVYLICAGKGKFKVENERCLYNNSVKHSDLPWFYSAADIFVLPTLNEGCCNAIIEAMACGLPIVSTNAPFNNDILDDSCSIRINPIKINEIADAIKTLYSNHDLMYKLRMGSIEKAKSFTLKKRAAGIIEFINEKII